MRGISRYFLALRASVSMLPFMASIAAAMIICYLDYASSYEYPFTLLYLGPVALITIDRGRLYGLGVALLCTTGAITAYYLTGKNYPSFFVCLWDFSVTFGMFTAIIITLDALLSSLIHEEKNARIDPLTGLLNRTSFYEIATAELVRCRRYGKPFNLLYLDLDNFKAINDTLGHETGDLVLQESAKAMTDTLRSSDKVFRMGGDEFVILIPEIEQEGLQSVARKVEDTLGRKMLSRSWPVTCSLGAVSSRSADETLEQLLTQADLAMYAAKKARKQN